MGKKRLLFLTLLMTICSCLFAQSYHYQYGYEFANNMPVRVIEVSIDGEPQSSVSLELGAFCETSDIVNRGSEFFNKEDNCWYVLVYGEYGDFISFKLYDHSTGKEYSDFTINVNGSREDGLIFNQEESYLDLEIDFKSPYYVYEGEGGKNMAITAVVSIDGDEQKSDKLELGAFCGNEVRGSVKTDYIYKGKYLAAFTVNGNNGDAISFKLYDHESGTEIEFNEVTTITFNADANYGTAEDPYTINFVTKDYVAEIVDGNKYETLEAALEEAKANDVIRLLQDVTINESINVEFSMTLDGDGHTLTYTGEGAEARAITVESNVAAADLTVENLTIDCTASYCQRGINYNTTDKLTLNGVTVKGTNVTYAVNLPSNSDGSIITIENSSLNGNIALNIWGENTEVNATDSDFISVDNASHENYAAISINNNGSNSAEGTALNITRGSIKALDENGDWSTALSNATINSTWNISQGTEVIGYIRDVVAIIPFEGSTQYYSFFTLQDAVDYAVGKNNVTVKVIRDVELTEMVQINGNVTLDLNSKTVTSSSTKTFEVYANATIKNGTIANTAEAGRCVDTRKNVELALIDVNLDAKTGGGNNQALTIGGSENGTKVNLTNVNIVSGDANNYQGYQGYGIITFVQTELNVVDSDILGYMAIYVKDGSQGSVINVSNSTLTSDMLGNNVAGNATSVIALEADNVKVNVVGGEINTVGDYMYAVGTAMTNNEIIVDSEINGNILHPEANVDANLIVVRDDYSNTLIQQGYAVSEYQEGLVKIESVVVAQIKETGAKYGSLAAAIAAAQAGETVELLADVTEDVTISKNLTIDGAGKNYTGNISVDNSVNSNVEATVKNVNFVNGTGYAITTNRIKSITVENCTVTNYGYGFLYANKSTPTVVVKNVTVDGGNYGFHWVYGTTASLENVTMTNVTNGLYIQNYASKTINVKNSNISSIAIWERDNVSGVQTFNFEGASTVGSLTDSQYAKYVLAATDATLKAEAGKNVETIPGYKVVYDDVESVYSVEKLMAYFKGGAYSNYSEPKNREHFGINLYDVYAQNELVVKVYHNDDLLLTTTLREYDLDDDTKNLYPCIVTGEKGITVANVVNLGEEGCKPAGSWENVWEVNPTVANVPNRYEVYVDGVFNDELDLTQGEFAGFSSEANLQKYLAFKSVYKAASVTRGEDVTYYMTLAEAWNDATQDGDVVTLYDNAELASRLDVTNKITLNLNGKNITANFEDQYGAIYVKKDAELTITGEGDITSEGYAIGTYGTVNIEGGNITTTGSDYAALYVFYHQIDYEGIANIKGGSLNTVWNCGTLSVSGGKIDYLDTSSELDVTDGVITKMYAKDGGDASGVYEMHIENIETTVPTVEVPEHFKFVEIRENVYQVVAKVYVAQTETGAKFETLKEAIDAAQANETVTVIKAHKITSTAVVERDITIDFGGLEVTSSASPAIRIQGGANVIVKNGNMNTDNYNFILGASDGSSTGNLTIESGSYKGASSVASVTKGLLTIKGGDFSLVEGTTDFRYLINCIDANYNDDSANVEIYGGTFHGFDPENNAAEGTGTNFCADGYLSDDNGDGTWTVRQGVYVAQVGDKKFESFDEAFAYAKSTTDNDAITILKTIVLSETKTINFENIAVTSTVNPAFRITNGATITVENGNMNTENGGYNFILGASDGSSAGNLTIKSGEYHASTTVASVTKGNLVIEGGEFSATQYNGDCRFLINCIDANYNADPRTANVEIKGGMFHNWNPQDNAAEGTGTDFCHADYAATETAENVWTVLPAVAEIGEARFATLQDAVNAADATNNTIDLIADVQLDTYVTISKSVNLNLAQFNITRENGTALYVNGADIEVNINGEGTVSGAQAVYVDNGTVTIDGGNYVGYHAVYVINNGHAVINDGTFKLKEGADPNFLLNEYDATRDITTIAVKGGTFHGFDPENNAAEGAGTNFCAEGYVSDDNGNGTWTVRRAAYVAQVNDGAKYESLVEAYDAAQSGDVVTLLTDATGAGLKINKDITIDFGGYTYTINQAVGSNNTESQGFQLLKNNTVTLKNGNIAIAENTNVKWMFNAYANVTIENVNVNCANMAEPAENEANYVLVVNNGGSATPTVTYTNVIVTNFPSTATAQIWLDPTTTLKAGAGLEDSIKTQEGYVVVYNNGAYIAIPEVSVDDAVAKIDEILFKTFAEAYETAVDGDEIVILKDITFNSIVEIHKNITIDINDKTLTGTAEKFFRVFADVRFEYGNIVNNTNNGRCVETRTGDIALELDNVSLIAENGASQPLTIGGSGDNIAVNINASKINAGKYGYAVIVFNPVQMNIESSTVEGWSALYFKGEDNSLGSAGSVVNVNDSEITGTNHVSASDPTNTFATIQFEDENVTLNVNGDDSRIRAYEEEHNHQYVFALPETNDIKVNVDKTVIISAAHFLNCDLLGNAEIILPKFYKEDINEEGYWAEDYGNDQVIVRQQFIAVASIGETLYQSLEEAVEAAVAGDEITLLKDVETEYDSYDFTNVTLNLNGNTIYTQSYFVGDNFTITNGNVDGRNANYGLRIGNVNAAASNVIIDNLNVVGGVEVYNASNVTLTNNTVNGTGEYAVLARENVTDLEIKSGTYYGTEGMDAVYHNGESEVITTGGTYNSNVELAGYCPDGYYAKDNGNGTWTVIRSAALSVELSSDWNWFSSYVLIDGTQGFSALSSALTGFGSQIKAENGQYSNYNSAFGEWIGSLTSTSTDKMYKIYASQAGTVHIEGTAAHEVEITLYPGLNWIAYPIDKPLNIVDAFRNHTPTNGDQLRTIDSYVEYTDFGDPEWADYNGWYETNGDLNVRTLIPGQGYIYDSKADVPVTFIFNADAPAVTAKTDSDTDRYWNVNPHLYPSNMTITAVLNIDGELAEGNYEIAAFSNGECRGSARAIYVEPLKQYMVMLLVHGEGFENLTFKCYDIDDDMVYELDNAVVYSDDARLGSMKEPYVFSRNTTGIEDGSLSMINVYPNPTTTNSEINLNAVCDKVEVFNALGVKIAEYDNVDSIDPLQTAGVYVIRVSNNDDVTHCRLVVK